MGHLNGILAQVGGNLKDNFQKSQMPGGLPGEGGMLKLRFDRYMHFTAMFYYFTQIVNMNRVEKCMYNKCMGLYGSPTRVNDLVIVYCFYI